MSHIISPVMRFFAAADTARAAAFYQDILGFQIRHSPPHTDALSGPAQIRFSSHDYDPDNLNHPLPTGHAMAFFEVTALDQLHAAITHRGGLPSPIQKLNWIKYRAFQITDPDQHILWFAESYNFPTPAPPPPMFEKALPNSPLPTSLPPSSGTAATSASRSTTPRTTSASSSATPPPSSSSPAPPATPAPPPPTFTSITPTNSTPNSPPPDSPSPTPPVSHPWGLRDFQVTDPEGNILTFGQPFE